MTNPAKLARNKCGDALMFLMMATMSMVYIPQSANSQALNASQQQKQREAVVFDQLIKDDPYRALDLLRARLTRDPNNSALLVAVAELEFGLEQTKLSAKHFEQYLTLNPKCQKQSVYMGLANDYIMMGQMDKALALYNKAIPVMPKSGVLYCERGCVYSAMRQLDKSIVDLTKAVELEPKNEHFVKVRGEIYAKNHDYAKAAVDLSTVITMGHAPSNVYAQRAEMYKKLNKPDLAQRDLQKVNQFGLDLMEMK